MSCGRQEGFMALSVASDQAASCSVEKHAHQSAAVDGDQQLINDHATANEHAEFELAAAQTRFKVDPTFTNLLAVQTLLQNQTRSYFASRRALSPTRTVAGEPRIEVNMSGESVDAYENNRSIDTDGSIDGDEVGSSITALNAIQMRLRAEEEERKRLNAEQELVVEQLRVAEEQNRLLAQQLEETVQKASEAAAANARIEEELAGKMPTTMPKEDDHDADVGAPVSQGVPTPEGPPEGWWHDGAIEGERVDGASGKVMAWGDDADDPLD
jgi:hypothetical protein